MKISFLCMDLSDNSLGRAALLARVLSRHYEVELIGPAKTGGVWFPLRDLGLPVKLFPWRRYPGFACTARDMLKAIEGDILFACKLRPTSFGLGLLGKLRTGKPLVVDIDDWELGFFCHTDFWGKLGRFLNLSNPNGLPYVWLMEKLAGLADAVTVSNRFLQGRFSGELLYHCRDTSALDPARHDPLKVRRRLGLEGKKIVMFLGTPRAHKGIDDVADALSRVRSADAHLVLVGVDKNFSFPEKWSAIKDRTTLVPQVPFEELGDYLASADVVAVPQRQTSDTAGQMPAKIFDAMAMARPIVSTRVSDIPEVLSDCGYLVAPGNPQQLADAIDRVLEREEEARRKGQMARDRCVRLYDIKVLEERLLSVVSKVARKSN
ncbi:MAG: glycosyltransferase [Nitrospinae bacterium]|nr:glycosyltransferase [Nitrospinota bacterium]